MRAAGWDVPAAPVLGDCAYGDNTGLRERLHDAGSAYVLSVSAQTTVFPPETVFAVPEPTAGRGRPASRPRPDREPESIGSLIERLGPDGVGDGDLPRWAGPPAPGDWPRQQWRGRSPARRRTGTAGSTGGPVSSANLS